MALVLSAGPLQEPLSLSEAKAQLKVDSADEDVLIAALITAARLHVEALLSRALITQTWSYFLDCWPVDDAVFVPLSPLQSISTVQVYDDDGNTTVIGPEHYFVDAASEPGRLVRSQSGVWAQPGRSANGIEIIFTSGFGDNPTDVPQPIRQAILMLVTHWYVRREPVTLGETSVQVPGTVESLLAPYKMVRL